MDIKQCQLSIESSKWAHQHWAGVWTVTGRKTESKRMSNFRYKMIDQEREAIKVLIQKASTSVEASLYSNIYFY